MAGPRAPKPQRSRQQRAQKSERRGPHSLFAQTGLSELAARGGDGTCRDTAPLPTTFDRTHDVHPLVVVTPHRRPSSVATPIEGRTPSRAPPPAPHHAAPCTRHASAPAPHFLAVVVAVVLHGQVAERMEHRMNADKKVRQGVHGATFRRPERNAARWPGSLARARGGWTLPTAGPPLLLAANPSAVSDRSILFRVSPRRRRAPGSSPRARSIPR